MYGTIWEYVYDYSNGAVRLGLIDDEGKFTWRPTSEPNS